MHSFSLPRLQIRWLVLIFAGLAANLSGEERIPSLTPDLESRIEQLESLNRDLLDRLESLETDRSGVIPAGHAPPGRGIRRISSSIAEEQTSGPSDSSEDPPFYEVGTDTSLHAIWKNGVEIQNEHKDFRLHVGGRTQFDSSWFQTDPGFQSDPAIVNPVRDGVDFRRARLRMDGTMYEVIDWAVEYDFMNSVMTVPSTTAAPNVTGLPAPTDLWFAYKEVPLVGNIKVGNHKEPIGFEHLVSSRFLPFMERSFNQDAFYGAFNNGFSPGISIYDTYGDEVGVWALGIFKPSNNIFAADNIPGDSSVTGRITSLLWYEDEGAHLLHFGFSARHATLGNSTTRYRTRGPERSGLSASWPQFADSRNFKGDGQDTVNFELVSNMGSFTLQSEYLMNYVENGRTTTGIPAGTVFYHGGYVELLYFLTGEHREYSRKTGAFERVTPLQNAFLVRTDCGPCCGRGAWQAGFRYNYLDLNDQGIDGGILNDYTWGLNWFLNPNMKIQWNYSLTHRQSPTAAAFDGWNQGFGMRLAHDF